jgi:hypothetical protein
MKQTLPPRIVRVEDDFWRIRTDEGEVDGAEQDELEDYFAEIRIPYQMMDGRLCIPATISWETVYEMLSHFYDGRADVFPF